MVAFFEDPSPLIDKFNETINESQQKTFITIDVKVQKKEIERLKVYRNELAEQKKDFIAKNHEGEANLLFCIENSALAIQCELEMLVAIKEDKMDSAWASLIEAENIVGCVIRNHPLNPESLTGYADRLAGYEKLLFPQFSFSSVGYIIKKSSCSICNLDYTECDHLKGKVYMGELCYRAIEEADLEEVSIVDTPANKLCRVISYDLNGKTYDTMTLREIKHDNNAQGG